MRVFSILTSISDVVAALVWRWNYQHRTRYSTRLAPIQVWADRR